MILQSQAGNTPRQNYNLKGYMYPYAHGSTIYIAKTQKQPICPSADEWIEDVVYTYTMECYSAVKENEIMPFKATQMQLKMIILSKV